MFTVSDNRGILCESDLFRVATCHYYCARRVWQHRLTRAVGRAVERVVRGKALRLTPQPQCIDAVALVLWRVVWERHATSVNPPDNVPIDPTPAGVMLWLAARPLALDIQSQPSAIDQFDRELVDCYARCRLLATWMPQHGGMLVSGHALCTLLSRTYLRWDG
jgi:hypothetical protein